jgi:hypothetical protein
MRTGGGGNCTLVQKTSIKRIYMLSLRICLTHQTPAAGILLGEPSKT